VGYRNGGLDVGLNWRYLPSVADANQSLAQTTNTLLGVKAYSVFNFAASYKFEAATLRLGMDNVFNVQPRVVGANPAAPGGGDTNSDQTNANYYDVLGRRVYAGVSVKF
jgi:outer membrane receptor protein involved in Fe transport